MKKLYFIIPAILAFIFFFFYLSEKNQIRANLKAEEARLEQEAEERRLKLEAEKEAARKEAVVQAEKRAIEREKKEREIEAQKAELQAAKDGVENALQERERAYKLYLKLVDDRATQREQLRRAREQAKLQQVQVDHVKNSIKDVTAQRPVFEQAFAKIEAADRAAAAEAARLAAAAAAKPKK